MYGLTVNWILCNTTVAVPQIVAPLIGKPDNGYDAELVTPCYITNGTSTRRITLINLSLR
jgi:hypothetical protein